MSYFSYRRRVHFYETDLMGVVHHSTYLRFFEEARVAWLNDKDLQSTHVPAGSFSLAVVESRLRHQKAMTFNDEFEVRLQVKHRGASFHFQYAIYLPANDAAPETLVCTGTTHLVALDKDHKISRRLPPELTQQMEKESWTETWP